MRTKEPLYQTQLYSVAVFVHVRHTDTQTNTPGENIIKSVSTLQVQTGFCGCTPDCGGTTGLWWCICMILLVHLGRNGWRSGCTIQKHHHTGACCSENEVTKMCIYICFLSCVQVFLFFNKGFIVKTCPQNTEVWYRSRRCNRISRSYPCNALDEFILTIREQDGRVV